MLFYNFSYLFIFLPLTICFFFSSKFLKIDHKLLLILFSIFFYSYWNIYYLPIIILSITTNYFFYKKIIFNILANRKKYLILGIFFNILLLVMFKYIDFIIQNINLLFSTSFGYLNLPFPLAISFFTFQSIAFLVNVYDEDVISVKAKDFCLFIIFFPQLIAGPIVKYNFMMPQFNQGDNKIFNKKNFLIGLCILLIGLIKKVYFANTLGSYVDFGYANIEKLNFLSCWLLSLCFTFQFYFDFSGYVDMATGSALMLNITLPQNFNSPLKSTSIIDFWQRWHITLTNFLTNFIYYPLLKSLKKINFFNSMIVTIFVFLVAGVWHGPSWNFVLFGLFHGFGLVINHIYKKYFNFNFTKFLSWFLTFNYVNISFIFFRTTKIDDAIQIIKKMLDPDIFFTTSNFFDEFSLSFFNNLNLIVCFLLSLLICFFFKNSYEMLNQNLKFK